MPPDHLAIDVAGAMPGIAWPGLPLDPGAQLLAMQWQFEQSQWWSPEILLAAQDRQLDILLRHAAHHVPYYRLAWASAGLDPDRIGSNDFSRLPLLRRSNLQENFDTLTATDLPAQHRPVLTNTTSGSLGMPIRFLSSAVHQFFWDAITLRDHLWHRRDFSQKLATIRYNAETGGHPCWSGTLNSAVRTGPCVALSIRSTIAEQAAWLLKEAPGYVLTYPSILRGLAYHCRSTGLKLPSLRELRSFGEVVSDETRVLIEETLQVPLIDIYSAQETGYLALQCPAGSGYHVMAENVRLEVLDRNGHPCAPGEIGQVVVTTLHNFAMPLIRYAVGDFAEVGNPCSCGRGLPTLTRIMGRERNLIYRANGSQFWPVLGAADWIGQIPVRQLRLVQQAIGHLTLHYVMDRAMKDKEEDAIRVALLKRLPEPFAIAFERVERLDVSPNGKYEEVLCQLGT